ncbi:MAG: RluA family pseudouridine synthase [Deltaproteobacteria bacterium]|nr:RluA family pseudouridine synthase [Deltaproteobacteria bacterium]
MAEETFSFVVDIDEAGARLDALLAARRPDVSRTAFLRLIKEGLVLVEGSAVKPSHTARPGQEVSVTIPPPEPSDLAPEEIPLDILYEDDDLIVINKQPGIVVHPSPGHDRHTLVNALLHHCRSLSGLAGVERPGIVHRLDKDTSGVMIAAKNDLAHRRLTTQFASRTVKKVYLALAVEDMNGDHGTIELPICRHPVDRKRMHTGVAGGRPAKTEWEVAERFGCATLLSVRIFTGRTHQIRVHLAAMGHPVAGDTLYGSPGSVRILRARNRKEFKVPRQMLHAHFLAFDHPATNEPLSFTAPLPEDMETLLSGLRQTLPAA